MIVKLSHERSKLLLRTFQRFSVSLHGIDPFSAPLLLGNMYIRVTVCAGAGFH